MSGRGLALRSAGAIAILAATCSAQALNLPTNEFNNEFVKSSNFHVTNPNPVIVVENDGEQYHKVTNNNLVAHGRGYLKCRAAFRVNFIGHSILRADGSDEVVEYTDLYKPFKQKYGPANFSVSWEPSQALKQSAIKACNNHLNTEVAKGKDAWEVLSQPQKLSLKDIIYTRYVANCGNKLTGDNSVIFRQQTLDVVCNKSSKAQKPKPAPKLSLSHIDLQAEVKNYKGFCPETLKFTGHIHSNGIAGNVKYRFLVDGKAATGFKNLYMTTNQKHQNVYFDYVAKPLVSASPSKAGAANSYASSQSAQLKPQLQAVPMPVIEMQVVSMNQNLKAKADFAYTCTNSVTNSPAKKPARQIKRKADLTSRVGITIGQTSSAWGGTIVLTDKDKSGTAGTRGCRYRMQYDVVNIGDANAQGFVSLLYDANTSIHSANNLYRAAKSSKPVSGNILLKPGHHVLTAKIDRTDKVDESDENNNVFKVNVKVPGSCSGTPRIPEREHPLKPRSSSRGAAQ